MKQKRRRGTDVPPSVKSFIGSVIASPLEQIELPLRDFAWQFEKGDFHHWVDLFNKFDSFFDKYVNHRKDLNLERDEFLLYNNNNTNPSFPRDTVLEILRVSRIILENCSNRHLYSSFEHFSCLLSCTDADIIEATLQTLMAFNNKSSGTKTPIVRTASLTSKLFSLSQGWGGKEGGLGLISCCLPTETGRPGSTLHFEFYSTRNGSNGLRTIHIPDVHLSPETDFELFVRLVRENEVPAGLRFALLTRLRFARAFGNLKDRYRFVCIRLYAFILLVQAGRDSEDVTAFFANEPEFIDELLSLLSYHEDVPEKVRIVSILALVALCQDRSHQPNVLSSISNTGHRTILPTILQKSIDSITPPTRSTKCSVIFTEALLSLLSILVSSTPGSLALQEAGIIPTILPLLKDTDPQHLHLVTTCAHVIEGLLDYHPPSSALFRDLGGLDESILRLKGEVFEVDNSGLSSTSTKPASSSSSISRKGKEVIDTSQVNQPVYSDTVLLHNRRALMKGLLRVISLATYGPGTATRVTGSVETVLPHCLSAIFKKAKEFGGGIFSLSAHVLTDLIHKDPTCFPSLESAGLPSAFIDAITIGSGPLSSSDVVTCIPPCLDALCLNNNGLNLVKERNALRCFVKIFTSKSYLKALSGETAGSVSSGLDELLRHASVLRSLGVEMVIQILEMVIKLGNLNLPMDTDESEKNEMGDNESFVPECIANIVRLLEPIVQNLDTCRMFIEKKGVEAVIKLFDLESVPVSVSIGHTVSAAFKNFSPTQLVSLVRSVRFSLREHLNNANKLLGSVSGSGLQDVVPVKLQPVLKSLSSLEGLLSLANFLLKSNTVMIAELAVSEAEVLKELAKVYMEATWQASLLADCNKPDENLDNNMGEEEGTSTGTSPSTSVERETDSTELIRSSPNPATRTDIDIDTDNDSDTRVDQDFVSVVRSATNVHRHHGRMSSLARLRGGGRLIRHLEAFHSHADPERSNFALETSIGADTGAKKDPNSLVPEVLSKLGSTIRLFLTMIIKSLPARRRTETALSTASRTVLNGLSQLFLSALSYTGYSPPGVDSSLSVKCRYLGKISDDISALTFDSRRRACYSSTVNGFYTNGTFKELLTTFEATSQLLWTLPKSPEYPSWLLETLQNYFKLLEYYVNSSYLLTTTAPQSTQLLVQPVTNDLSINLFPLPRDPKGFVSVLQTQVLEAVLPVWNHPMLPNCPQSIISPLICIVDHICSEIGDSKHAGGAPGGVNPRLGMVPPIDEQIVTTIVDMGFSRARAEEALRNVGANNVELATDWLFTHPEEIVQEDLQLAQALALSLGNNNSNDESDAAKEDSPGGDGNNNNNNVAVPVLPLDDVLSVVAKLFRKKDELIVLALNDLLITLCNRNKGGDRNKVLAYLVQQLKLCPVGPGTDAGALYPIAHLLAFLLSEDSDTREVAAANGVVSVVLGILNFFLSDQRTGGDASPEKEKAITALLLVLDSMLQPNKPVVNPETAPDPTPDPPEKENEVKKSVEDTFGEILGKPSGYLTEEESQRVMNIACELVKLQVPASVMQACLQLCARLTKIHSLSTRFIETGVLSVIFNLPNSCVFPGFDSLASVIVRHLVEDPQTLQSAMEVEIKQALNGSGFLSRHGGRVSTRSFLTSMAPVISRDPVIFMKAAANVCQLDPSSGGRMNVVLFKDNKEKDNKDNKEKDRDNKDKGESTPSKCTRGHKKVPASLSHVMDRLLEIVLSYEPKIEESMGICQDGSLVVPMEIDEANNKGKSKVDDESEQPSVARVSLVLKLLSEILLMYSHTVLVLLKRDSEMMQMRGTCGVVHHVLHNLMPVLNKKISGVTSGDVSHIKLSEKASFFLVVLCSRSTEGRRRVISEIARAFSSFPMGLAGCAGTSSTSSGTSNWDNGAIVPDRRVWSLCYLVYVILSRSGSGNNMPGVGCSPDIARAMIEGGMVQSLSSLLKAIDLDHPDAPRVCNLILKSLESLTRAANLNEQVVKPDDSGKNRTTGSDHATGLSIREPDSAGTDMAIAEEQEGEREHPIESQEQDRVSEEDTGMDRGEDENPREESGLGLVGDEDEDDRDDDDEVDEDDDDEDDDDDDRDDGVGAVDHGAHMIPLADPDTIDDDEDEDEYNEDMIEEDEEDADVPANRFIEVRWQGGLSGLENLRVSRGRGFIEIASESFQGGGDETDELFNLHRSFGMERRRQPGASANSRSAALDRSAVSGFEHPLIARMTREQQQQQQQQQYIASREGAINPVTQFYMFTNGMQPEGGSGSLFSGDRLVGSSNAPSQSVDFSLGMESLRISGRRGGLGWDNRWTDDGQSQTSAVASAIALAVEDHFVSEIPTVPVQIPNASNLNPVPSDATVSNPIPSDTSNPNDRTTSPLVDVDVPMQPISSPPLLDPGIAMENNDQVLPDTELVAGDLNSNRDALMPDTDMVIGDSNSNMDALMSDMDSCHAVMSSNPPAPELSDAHVGTENEAEDVNNNNDENNESENPIQEQEQEPGPAEENEIDPTFLEALPEDLRAEVLASQQNRPAGEAAEAPAGGSGAADVVADAAEENEIDPEFLAALPPDIQAEVLAQQRAQRLAQSRQQARQPTDMDNASIIATFPPEIREEVLLTSSEAVLSGLPSELLAEAQLLRDRELSRYRSRGSLFGGSHQLHPRLVGGASRRFTIDGHHRPSGMDRGVGVSLVRRVAPAVTSGGKGKEVEGAPLFDRGALEALLRLFQLAQPLSKGILERLMLNLCAHSVTRKMLVSLLVDMIRPEAEGPNKSRVVGSCRLYGRKFNVVYAQPESPNGLPPLVSRRILEHLTYLASSHMSVADILSLSESSESDAKAVVGPAECKDTPLLLFLKLLKVPLFLRSRVHLEQVMLLLEVVVNNAVSKIDLPSESDNPSEQGTGDDPNTQPAEPVPEPAPAPEPAFSLDDPNPQPPEPLSKKESENIYVILTGLPESELGNLCNVLALEGLPSKVYSLASEVVKKLASIASTHGKFFSSELATLARSLSSSAISELSSLRTHQNLGFSTMTGTAILRVLQALCTLSSESEQNPILFDLNSSLEPLWQELSECISLTESKIGQSQTSGGEAGASTSSQPLPPGTQRLLPFIESFFVLCEKLQSNPSIFQLENTTVSPQRENVVTFARVAEKHRRLLNVFIRQNPSLLEKSLSMMLKVPRLIDFDNKRAYFRSRIRLQNDNHMSGPIRVSVRRPYILEDSYNQLRMRRHQDLKGRLTVQFQGEEGIDAGGLTREWYQLLSRVIFDKGTLLFTTVGNNVSFQPNPNSVYQTEHLSYFKFVGRVVAKALFDGQLLDVHFTRSFYKHILGVKVTYHDIEAVDPDYYKNLKWMLENDVSDIPDLTFSMDADEEKHILYEKNQVTDYELKPGGRNLRVTEETKHEYVDLVADHILTNAIRPQITAFLDGFTELIPTELISIFNDKELELLISGLPEIDLDDLRANAEYIGYTAASPVVQWFWEVVNGFSKEDMARLLQFVTGTSKVPLEGFKALQGISGAQRFQIHKAYGAPERLPSAHTCFNQLDLPDYNSKEQLEERLLLAIHEASEGFGFG